MNEVKANNCRCVQCAGSACKCGCQTAEPKKTCGCGTQCACASECTCTTS